MEDIKKKIEDIVERVKNDKGFAAKFKQNPVKALEGLLGVDLPDEQIKEVIRKVKAKANLETINTALDSDGDGKADLGGLFGKKE